MAAELHRKVLPGWHHARTCDKTVRSLHCAVDDVVKKQAGFVMDLGHIMHMQARWAWLQAWLRLRCRLRPVELTGMMVRVEVAGGCKTNNSLHTS